MTDDDTLELLGSIADEFPGRFVASARRAALWSEMFADATAAEVATAWREYLAAGPPHPPSVSDLRTRIAERRSPAPDVGKAWEEVRKAVQSTGRYRVPTWTSDRIASAVEALGWIAICDTDEDQVATLRAQFERYFRGGVDRERKAANVGSLEAARSGGALSGRDAMAKLAWWGGNAQ